MSDMPPFLPTYIHMVGKSEIPTSFHYWCAISLIAASLGKRVHTDRGLGQIYPNLYTFLIAGSGVGKNAAIDIAYELIRPEPFKDTVNPNRVISFTGPGFIDMMGECMKNMKADVEDAQLAKPIYILTPELGQSLGEATQARPTIKSMTEWYSGADYPMVDIKRTVGKTVLKGHCINWLAGTTEEWLMESISQTAMKGGFLPRIVPVMEHKNYANRIAKPVIPPNAEELKHYLKQWLYVFTWLGNDDLSRGPAKAKHIQLTQEANEINEDWYQNRPEPDHDDLQAVWTRQYDLTQKLGMIFSIADPAEWHFNDPDNWWYGVSPQMGIDFEYSMLIREHHIAKAQEVSNIVMRNAPRLLELLTSNINSTNTEAALVFIKKHQRVSRSMLAKYMARRVNKLQLDSIIDSLVDQHQIKVFKSTGSGEVGKAQTKRPTTYYSYVGGTKLPTWYGTGGQS